MSKWTKEDETALLRRLVWGDDGGWKKQPASLRVSTREREISRHEVEMNFWRMGKMALNA